MSDLTFEQNEQLKKWSSLRDEALQELSKVEIELKSKKEELSIAALDLTIKQKEFYVYEGKIEEIKKSEEILRSKVSSDILDLEKEKSKLVETNNALAAENQMLIESIEALNKMSQIFSKFYEGLEEKFSNMFNKSERIIDKNTQNSAEIASLFEELKKVTKEMTDLNKLNVTETNIVLKKLPAMLLELQKHKLIRPNFR